MTDLSALYADFQHEALYTSDAWFIHELLEVNKEEHRVVGRLDTTKIGHLVQAQRVLSGHVKHLPAAIAVQMTGTLGQLYAVYVMGLRATEGWAGYGTHIHSAKFATMGTIGEPVEAAVTATRRRNFRGTWFVDFEFRFEQGGKAVYLSKQSAAWRQLPS